MQQTRGAVWALALALAVGCSSSPQPIRPNATPTPDAGPSGPFDITIASSPPIELAGVALWLDADYGVARDGAQVRAWTDRSGHGHVLVPESNGDGDPGSERLAGHGALRFGGGSRMVLAAATEEQARAALTIGDQDFLIALVVRKDGGRPDPTFFALAPYPVTADFEAMAAVSLDPALAFTVSRHGSASGVHTRANLDGGKPRLVVVASIGPRLVARLDGYEIGMRPLGRLEGERMDGAPIALPYLAPFVGEWDFDIPGWTGLVGDVVVVTGPGVEGAIEPLEGYLKQKYGL